MNNKDIAISLIKYFDAQRQGLILQSKERGLSKQSWRRLKELQVLRRCVSNGVYQRGKV